MSIQYTAPGFKPTLVVSHNHKTRAPAQLEDYLSVDYNLIMLLPT